MKIPTKYLLIISIVLLAIMFLLGWCTGKKSGSGKVYGDDTVSVVRVDTLYKDTGSITYVPKIIKEYDIKEIPVFIESHDTLYIVDTVKDWLTVRHIIDTQKIKYGSIFIEDFVFKNRIMKRTLSHDIYIPSTIETITIREQPKPHVSLYAGLSVSTFWSAGIRAGVQDKRGRIWLYGYNNSFNGQQWHEATVLWKIGR